VELFITGALGVLCSLRAPSGAAERAPHELAHSLAPAPAARAAHSPREPALRARHAHGV
jgi:hypothetical protein